MAIQRVNSRSYITDYSPTDPATIPRDEQPFEQVAQDIINRPDTPEDRDLDDLCLSGIESRIQNGPYTLSMALESITTAMCDYIVPRTPPSKSEMYIKRTGISIFASTMAYFIAIQPNITPDYLPWIKGAFIAGFVFHYLHSAIPKPTLNN